MLKKLLLGLSLLVSAMAQSQSDPRGMVREDAPVIHMCGTTPEYLSSLGFNAKVVNHVPANAIINCGKFDIYYEDLIPGNPQAGFSDPSLGADRRNTLCAVLTYIQSVINFNNIPTNQRVRLLVRQSLAPVSNPAPAGTQFFAFAGPGFTNTGVPHLVNGYVFDYITTGVDPTASNNEHATLTVNFDAISINNTMTPINYLNNHLQPMQNCQYDLFYVLLHEMGHALGILSYAHNGNGTLATSSVNGNNQFSGLDFSLRRGTVNSPTGLVKMITGTPASPSMNAAFISGPGILNNDIWLNGSTVPSTNHPMYSGILWSNPPVNVAAQGSLLSHFEEQIHAYSLRSRTSPGFQENYIMGAFGKQGVLGRRFADAEINLLISLGYTLNPSYPTAELNNTPPYSTKTAGYTNILATDFAETIPVDFTMTNNIGSSLAINLSSDATITDINGNVVRVEAGSLINLRGCGRAIGTSNGNNHDLLSVSTDGLTITYTPRPNFYGRAQFAFRLHDGIEGGSYHMYTINVLPGSNVSVAAGGNMIMNGDMENGTEVKKIGSFTSTGIPTGSGNEELIDHSSNQTTLREGKFFRGMHLSDGHPYNYHSLFVMPYGGGNVIHQSHFNCDPSATAYTSTAGFTWTSYPNPGANNPNPATSANSTGERYRPIYWRNNYFSLLTAAATCKRYILKFDYANKTNIVNTATGPITYTVGFLNAPQLPQPASYNHSFTDQIPVLPLNTWGHHEIPFTYCGTSSSMLMNIEMTQFFPGDLLFDNVELVEVTTPLPPLLATISGNNSICTGTSTTLTAGVTNPLCNVTYSWSNGATTQSITVSPSSTTNYTVTVNDGCRNASASRTVSVTAPPVIPALSNVTACAGTTVGGTSITSTPAGATLTWTNSNSFIGLPNMGTGNVPSFAAVNGSSSAITGTITVTPSIGNCVGTPRSYTITIHPQPAITAPANITVCKGATVAATGFTSTPSGAIYYWSNSNTNIGLGASGMSATIPSFVATNTTSSPITATITVIPKLGNCLGNAIIYTITVNPAPIISVSPASTTITAGGSVVLNASGAGSYTWTPATGLSCTNCASPTASPTVNTTYTVSSTNAYGCTGTATALVNIAGASCTTCPNTLAPGGTLSSSPASGLVYCVNNSILVTGNVNIFNSELKMAANTQIIVANGATLSISGSHLYSCGAMWQGILVMPGGKVTTGDAIIFSPFSVKSSLIEDAVVAIEIAAGSPLQTGILTVNNTIFNRNRTGIRVNDYNQQLATYPFTVYGATFTCRNLPFTQHSLVWPQPSAVRAANTPTTIYQNQLIDNGDYLQTGTAAFLKAPYNSTQTKSAAGIELINVGETLNAGSTSPTYYEFILGRGDDINIFDNMVVGVNLISSNFKSVNNIYQNTGIKGIGINTRADASRNNRLQVVSVSTTTGSNKFVDCGMAINSNNYFEHNIQYSDIRSSQVNGNGSTTKNGITINTNRYRVCNVLRNTIYNVSNAIVFNATTGNYNVSGANAFGQYGGKVNIDFNTIQANVSGTSTAQYVLRAIFLQNSGNISELANQQPSVISTNSNTIIACNGIYYLNWRKQDVQSQNNNVNIVLNPYFFVGYEYQGITLESCFQGTSNGNFVRSNTVTGFYTPTAGTPTIIEDQVRGITMALSGQFNVRCNTINKTTTGIMFTGGNVQTSLTNNVMSNHRYGLVLKDNGLMGPQGTPTSYPDNQWTGTWLSGTYKTAVLQNSSASNSIMRVRSLANYNPNGSGYALTNPLANAYSTSSFPIQNLYTYVNSTIPALPCLQIIQWPNSFKSMEDIVQDNIVYTGSDMPYINKFNLFRILKEDTIWVDSSVVLDNFYNASMAGPFEGINRIERQMNRGRLFDASLSNAVFVPANDIEANYKEFFDLHTNYLQGMHTPANNASLLALASKCPFEDGNVVYQARALYNSIQDDFIIFGNNCTYEASAAFSKNMMEEEKTFDYLIYPNPAKNEVYVSSELDDDAKLKILVTDLNGKIVFQNDAVEVSSFVSKFNLNVNDGVYIVHVTNPLTNETNIKKIIIQQ